MVSHTVLNGVWVAGCTARKYSWPGMPFSLANAHIILHGRSGSSGAGSDHNSGGSAGQKGLNAHLAPAVIEHVKALRA